MGINPTVMPMFTMMCVNQPAVNPKATSEANGVARPRRDAHRAQQQHAEQSQRDRDAEEPQLLPDHGEDEVGVLLRQECEPLLRAEREALPEEAARPDGHLRLEHVVARSPRIGRRIEEHEQAVLLVRIHLRPQQRRDHAHHDVRRDRSAISSRPTTHPHQSSARRSEEPRPPDPGAERQHETDARARDHEQQRPRDAAPEEHREEDPEEHDAGAEVRLRHDQQPRHQRDQPRDARARPGTSGPCAARSARAPASAPRRSSPAPTAGPAAHRRSPASSCCSPRSPRPSRRRPAPGASGMRPGTPRPIPTRAGAPTSVRSRTRPPAPRRNQTARRPPDAPRRTRHVGLPRRVDHRDAERREQEGERRQRPVGGDPLRAHQPSTSGIATTFCFR